MGVVAGSGSGALVVMMKTADLGDRDHATAARWMNRPVLRGIHLQRLMRSPTMVVTEVAGQDLTQVSLIQNDHVIEAFSPDTSDQPFDERVLPWTSRCSYHLLCAHVLDAALEVFAIDTVTVS